MHYAWADRVGSVDGDRAVGSRKPIAILLAFFGTECELYFFTTGAGTGDSGTADPSARGSEAA